ncbi:hypothetical protein LTR66_005804 [Elasticomyces elasticus]|nr:hypothetical protein LTR66_005804 [Elasticomyces elasticus]
MELEGIEARYRNIPKRQRNPDADHAVVIKDQNAAPYDRICAPSSQVRPAKNTKHHPIPSQHELRNACSLGASTLAAALAPHASAARKAVLGPVDAEADEGEEDEEDDYNDEDYDVALHRWWVGVARMEDGGVGVESESESKSKSKCV